MNAFQQLGIATRLEISEEELAVAFRAAGKLAHPDAGGDEHQFATLREAFGVVSSPSRRLRQWMELRGTPGELRGSIDDSLMNLFAEVGSVTQRAEALLRKRDEAKSALVRAMLEGETQLSREAVEKVLASVEGRIGEACAIFPEFENSPNLDVVVASEVARNLAFLEKWRFGLRAYFSRLV